MHKLLVSITHLALTHKGAVVCKNDNGQKTPTQVDFKLL